MFWTIGCSGTEKGDAIDSADQVDEVVVVTHVSAASAAAQECPPLLSGQTALALRLHVQVRRGLSMTFAALRKGLRLSMVAQRPRLAQIAAKRYQ